MLKTAIVSIGLVMHGLPAAAAESAYTTLNVLDGSCKPTSGQPQTQEEIDLGVLSVLCPGLKDFPVQFDSSDERESVHYGDPKMTTTEPVWESFEGFNTMADKFEWRLANGIPFAAIHRFTVDTGPAENADGTGGPPKAQILLVSKVGQPGQAAGCVAALVDALANTDANEIARKVADSLVPGFTCGKDKAGYHGKRGKLTVDFYSNFEGQ